jgi:hypothetical protein
MASITGTIATVDATAAKYASAVLTGVLAVEAAAKGLPGETKAGIVLNTIITGATVAESAPIPAVAGIAALINLTVSILNAAGVFTHAAPAVVPPAPAAAPAVS